MTYDYFIRVMEEIIVNNVQKFRRAAGHTQEDLAEKVGVSRQTVIAIEKGNYTPSVLLALKIAQVFDRPVSDVFAISYEK